MKLIESSLLASPKVDVLKKGVLAQKRAVVIMLTNHSGRELVYHIIKNGEKAERRFPKGMHGNISTTDELNAHFKENELGEAISTTKDSNDLSTKSAFTDFKSAREMARQAQLPLIGNQASIDTVLGDLLDSNHELTEKDIEISVVETATKGYFSRLSEDDFPDGASIQKSWGEQHGHSLFLKISPTTDEPLEIYFNDDGQAPFITDINGESKSIINVPLPEISAPDLGMDIQSNPRAQFK